MVETITGILLIVFSEPIPRYTPDANGYTYIKEVETAAPHMFPGFRDSILQMPGWPKSLDGRGIGACLADVDQDGFLEVLVGTEHGRSFHVWDYEGNYLLGWPKTNLDTILAKPAVADIDPGYPGLEIIVNDINDAVYAWHYDGSVVSGWPHQIVEAGHATSPVIFDIDGDGDLEIIVGERDYPRGRVTVFNHDGTIYPGWPQQMNHMCVATPSVADVDADGEIEICMADYNGLFVWDKNGNLEPGWPVLDPDWWSSYAQPVLADLDDDGDLEILAAYHYGPPIFQAYIAILHHDGAPFVNWPQEFTGGQSYVTPVVADIDIDNDLEIFGGGHCAYPLPDLLVRHHTGDTVMGWPVPVGAMECSPAVLDLDLNDGGKREILVNNNTGYPYGDMYGYNDDGTMVPGFPLNSGCSFPNSPAVGDVDQDGDIEIAFVAESLLYLWTIPDREYRPYMVEWGTWFHDNWNTGWFHPKAPDDLQATSSPGGISLAWTANTEPDIAGYNVYRGETSGIPYTKINDTLVTGTQYLDVPPVNDTLFYYCITAQIKAGIESRLSNEVSGYVGIREHLDTNNRISSFAIYPNPFFRMLNVVTPCDQSSTIRIYDCQGVLVSTVIGKGTTQWHADRHMPAGVYFVEVDIFYETFIRKIIKLK